MMLANRLLVVLLVHSNRICVLKGLNRAALQAYEACAREKAYETPDACKYYMQHVIQVFF